MTTRPQLGLPADTFFANSHADPDEEVTGYTTGDEMTSRDSQVVDHMPQLVDSTEGGPSGATAAPLAYDWRTNVGRALSAAPYGLPRQGDTYTRDGDTYHTVEVSPIMQPIELLFFYFFIKG